MRAAKPSGVCLIGVALLAAIVARGGAIANEPEREAGPVADLEQLLQTYVQMPAMQQEVTTVSGQQSTVGRSPAAVFVITEEMIRHSGATCLPEVLRMAPGLQVARINSSQWAITARGFNTNIAGLFASNNKLLVLIDGRTVYTPFFSGTYWDVQDVILEDVERIEVIRGPGAAIWGANAMNGVINVITKQSSDTQGGLAVAGGGSAEQGFARARIGGRAASDATYRAYGSWFERDASMNPARAATDDWRQARGGFRTDWKPEAGDLLTVQGDVYQGKSGFLNTAPAPDIGDDERVQGGNLLARWTRTLSDENDFAIQLYYDRADRLNNIGFLNQEFNTADADFRHHLRLDDVHNLVWGLGYRSVADRMTPLTAPPAVTIPFSPAARTYDTFSTFVQDEIALGEPLVLTLGTKLQHNDFTGWEVQPTARLLYSPEQSWAAWAAVSRAVRTPSRIENDAAIAAGGVPFLDFVPTFGSEELIAYEIGYRSQPVAWFSWDGTVFYNQYQHLSALALTPPGILPIVNTNDNRGAGYGAEATASLDLSSRWRLTGSYSFLQLQIEPGQGTVNFLGSDGRAVEGSSPHRQVYLASTHRWTDVEFDAIGRYVDNLPFQNVPSYITLDLRLARRLNRTAELAIVGQNLLDSHHPEFGGAPPSEIRRGVYAMLTKRW